VASRSRYGAQFIRACSLFCVTRRYARFSVRQLALPLPFSLCGHSAFAAMPLSLACHLPLLTPRRRALLHLPYLPPPSLLSFPICRRLPAALACLTRALHYSDAPKARISPLANTRSTISTWRSLLAYAALLATMRTVNVREPCVVGARAARWRNTERHRDARRAHCAPASLLIHSHGLKTSSASRAPTGAAAVMCGVWRVCLDHHRASA